MTILGKHSVEELKQLLEAFDYTVDQVQKDFNAFEPEWSSRELDKERVWKNEWTALRKRYSSARKRAIFTILASNVVTLPFSMIPAEDEYEALRRALKRSPDGPFETGDLQDLYNRLVLAQKRHTDFSEMPTPTGDVDLTVMNTLGDTLTELKKAKASFASEPVVQNLALYIGGGVFALGAILILSRRL